MTDRPIAQLDDRSSPARTAGHKAAAGKPRAWRAVALPAEHGGWSFLLEPLLLGLLVAPTAAGWLLAVATAAGFLLRTPLKLVWLARSRGVTTPRTRLARRFAAGYALTALLGLAGAVLLGTPAMLLPLLFALPLMALFAFEDFMRPGRTLAAELAAPAALGAVASCMALADGWPLAPALLLWAALAARALPTILFVRSRLRLDKGKLTMSGHWYLSPVANVSGALAAHLIALTAMAALVLLGPAAPLLLLAYAVLLLRAVILLAPGRPRLTVPQLGVFELVMGLMTVLVIAAAAGALGL